MTPKIFSDILLKVTSPTILAGPILMEYGQPLFVSLSRDGPSVRVYRLYGWGGGDYQKEGRGVSDVS